MSTSQCARRIRTFFLALAVSGGLPAVAQSSEVVDLELVLAIDASGSVDADEFQLQLRGTAGGFRDAAVVRAIQSGPHGRIAVSAVLWADATLHASVTDWYILASAADAETFAARVEALPRDVGGGTGVGAAIANSIRHIEDNAITGIRRVVDVSGDGPETPPRSVGIVLAPQARDMALARGITVNGLAILSDVADLNRWYSKYVTAGPGSFVVTAADFDDFARAMRHKLLREISSPIARIKRDQWARQAPP